MRCPNCGVELNLTLNMEKGEASIKPNDIGKTVTFKMNYVPYTLSKEDIIKAARNLKSPDTIRYYFVKLEDDNGKIKEFPIKQVVREALKAVYTEGFSEEKFTSQRAKHVLTKLGFAVNKKW